MSRGGDNDTYKYFIKTLAERHPKLAYLHVIESRDRDEAPTQEMNTEEFLALWSPKPYISTGGHTRTSGIKVTDHHDNVLVAYGRQFLANVGFHPTLHLCIPDTPPPSHLSHSLTFQLASRRISRLTSMTEVHSTAGAKTATSLIRLQLKRPKALPTKVPIYNHLNPHVISSCA
jgi:NADH:flavin oxidoreductase / NADH oxidase family